MNIYNDTRFVVEKFPYQLSDNNYILVIIVKATYDILENRAIVTSFDQTPVLYADELYDNEKGGSTKFESDLVPTKVNTDVLLAGNAYAPNHQAVNALDVFMRVGPIEKSLRVVGDRYWLQTALMGKLVASDPAPFTEMPMVYENAFGGINKQSGDICPSNPVGKGIIGKKAKAKTIVGVALPNIENPYQLINGHKDQPDPVGFGPIGKGWSPRLSLLGTYNEKWEKERSPLWPEDFSVAFFNAAPQDQQVPGFLKGDEPVYLKHLNANGDLAFNLPGDHPNVSVVKKANSAQSNAIEMRLDTLTLLPNDNKFVQLWRGACVIKNLTAFDVKSIHVSV